MKSVKNKSHNKVVIGLSGGVDSAVSAYLLKKAGYDVSAVYLMCWKEPGCRAEQDRKDTMKTALELNIPFQVLDFRKEYKETVMENFYEEYRKGRTPNPDILCNSVVKFGIFYEWSIKNGYDFVATGHYAQTDGESLFSGKDLKKDQSYFLYRLRQEQLKHILFPIGDLLKSEVREIAKKNKLSVAEKKDSMGICFVGDVNVKELLVKKYGKKKGRVILEDGTIIGKHDGYWFFNVGHRGGWERNFKIQNSIFKNNELPKLYVVEIRKETNEIVVGEREELLRDEFCIKDLSWMDSIVDPSTVCFQTKNRSAQDDKTGLKSLPVLSSEEIFVKIRNTGEFIGAFLEKVDKDKIRVKLAKKVFGVSGGQSCVIYKRVNYESSLKETGCSSSKIMNQGKEKKEGENKEESQKSKVNSEETDHSSSETQNQNLKLKIEKRREEKNGKNEICKVVGGGVIE